MPPLSGSTLSVLYAADLMALLLLGLQPAIIVAVAGVLMQCSYKVKKSYPLYRTLFSAAAEVLTMTATGIVYQQLGGSLRPLHIAVLAKPLVGAIAAYFIVNTSLVAGAIALTSGRSFFTVWRDDFLWSGASFMVAGSAGAMAAVVVARGEHWKAILLIAPIYLTTARTNSSSAAWQTRRGIWGKCASSIRNRRGAGAGASGRARGTSGTLSGGAREPLEGSVPRGGLARAADAAQRHSRMGRHVAPRTTRRDAARSRVPVDLRQRTTAGAIDR